MVRTGRPTKPEADKQCGHCQVKESKAWKTKNTGKYALLCKTCQQYYVTFDKYRSKRLIEMQERREKRRAEKQEVDSESDEEEDSDEPAPEDPEVKVDSEMKMVKERSIESEDSDEDMTEFVRKLTEKITKEITEKLTARITKEVTKKVTEQLKTSRKRKREDSEESESEETTSRQVVKRVKLKSKRKGTVEPDGDSEGPESEATATSGTIKTPETEGNLDDAQFETPEEKNGQELNQEQELKPAADKQEVQSEDQEEEESEDSEESDDEEEPELELWSMPKFLPTLDYMFFRDSVISLPNFLDKIAQIRLDLPNELTLENQKEKVLEREFVWIQDWEKHPNFKRKLAEATDMTEELVTLWYNERKMYEKCAKPIEKLTFEEKLEKVLHFYDNVVPESIVPRIATWANCEIDKATDYLATGKKEQVKELTAHEAANAENAAESS